MFSHFKNLFKHSIIYGFGQLAGRMAGFVLIPIYTRYFIPEIYGQLQLLMVGISLLDIFLSLGLGSAFFKFYFEEKSEQYRKLITNTIFFFLLVFSLICASIIFIFSSSISSFLLDSDQYSRLILLMTATSFFNAMIIIPLALLRAKEQSLTYSIISFTKLIFDLGLKIYFVVVLKMGIQGVLTGAALASCITLSILLLTQLKNLSLSISYSALKPILLFGAPLVPTQLAGWVLNLSDRYILKLLTDFKEIGLYSLGFKLGYMVYILLVFPFSIAWAPFLYSISKEKNAKEIYARLLTYFMVITSFMALALSYFSSEAIQILSTPGYADSAQVVPFIAFAYVFYGMYFIFTTGTNIKKKTYYFPFISGIAALCSIGLNFLLIPKIGMLGTGISALCAYFVFALLTLIVSQKFYKIPFQYFNILKVALLVITFLATLPCLNSLPFTMGIIIKIAALILFLLLIVFLNVITFKEIKSLKSQILKRIQNQG